MRIRVECQDGAWRGSVPLPAQVWGWQGGIQWRVTEVGAGQACQRGRNEVKKQVDIRTNNSNQV